MICSIKFPSRCASLALTRMMNATSMCVVFLALLTLSIASLDNILEHEIMGSSDTCSGSDEVDITILNKLRERIVSKNSKLLVKFLTSDCFPKDTEILQFANFLSTVYDEALTRAIYFEAIDVLYTMTSAETVAAYLWQLYRKGNIVSFKLMLDAQLYLYSKFTKRGGINNAYLLNVGYYFYKVKQDQLHAQLADRLRDDLSAAIDRLPSTLQFFYFKSDFCLFNKGYDEYMYMADGIFFDTNRRYMFTWVQPGGEMSQGAWLKLFQVPANTSNPYTGGLPYTVALKGKKYGKFLYMDRLNENLLLAWEPGYQPVDASWSPQFVDGALVLEQNGYLMCASHKLDQFNERRYINGYSDQEHVASNRFCQWTAVECPLEN